MYGDRQIQPLMPAQSYKTYGMAMPLSSHFRRGTCEEVQCEPFLNGFVATFDLATDLGQKQYAYCKEDKDRSFSMQRVGLNIVKLVYKPGTPCFKRGEHRVPIGREPFFTVTGGDWRGNPRGTGMRHNNGENWVDDFANHQDKLKTALERG